jgi:hypothetical protein
MSHRYVVLPTSFEQLNCSINIENYSICNCCHLHHGGVRNYLWHLCEAIDSTALRVMSRYRAAGAEKNTCGTCRLKVCTRNEAAQAAIIEHCH